MAVRNINELKARFQTGDKPTSKDLVDLIDSLLAAQSTFNGDAVLTDYSVQPKKLAKGINGQVIQAGLTGEAAWVTLALLVNGSNAGGAFKGTFPNPDIRDESDDANDANRPVTGNTVRNGTLELKKFSTTAPAVAGVGAYPYWNGSGLIWKTPGSSGVPESFVSSGAIGKFVSTEMDIPIDGNVLVIPHGLGGVPDFVRWVAVCRPEDGVSYADHDAGQEVELSRFQTVSGYTLFHTICDDGVNLRVRVDISDGFDVFLRDNTTNGSGGGSIADLAANWKLKAYATRLISGTGFGSLTNDEAPLQALPVTLGVVSFTHNYNAYPLNTRTGLVCVSADRGYPVSTFVPLDKFTRRNDGTTATNNMPAFSTLVTATDVQVKLLTDPATIYVPDLGASGDLALIDPAKWKVYIATSNAISVPTMLFPALQLDVANPVGAVTHKGRIYYAAFNRFASPSATHPGVTSINYIDLTNSNSSRVIEYTNPPIAHCSFSVLSIDGVDHIVWAGYQSSSDHANSGIFAYNTATATHTKLVANSQVTGGFAGTFMPGDWRVLQVKPSGTAGKYDFYLVNDTIESNSTLNACQFGRLKWNAGTSKYVFTSRAFNWNDAAVPSGSKPAWWSSGRNPNMMAAFFNPIRKRFYLQESSTGLLHVFSLKTTGAGGEVEGTDYFSDLASWIDSAFALSDWTTKHKQWFAGLVRSVTIPGGGVGWNTSGHDRIALEYDTTTGTELSITLNRRGNDQFTGTITRISWPR